MRSVYTKILLWCFGVLVLSLAAFVGISVFVSLRAPGKNLFLNTTALQLEDAKEAYESGGPKQLQAYLRKLDEIFHARHWLIDAAGKDLVTGEDRSPLISRGRRSPSILHF